MKFYEGFTSIFNPYGLGQLASILLVVLGPIIIYIVVACYLSIARGEPK